MNPLSALLRGEIEVLRGGVDELRQALDKATSDREQYRRLYMQLLERCRLLERGIVAGQRAERFDGASEDQLSMQLLGMLLHPDEVVVVVVVVAVVAPPVAEAIVVAQRVRAHDQRGQPRVIVERHAPLSSAGANDAAPMCARTRQRGFGDARIPILTQASSLEKIR